MEKTKKGGHRFPRSFTITIERGEYYKEAQRIPHKSRGLKSRLGICQYVSILLKANETLPQSKKMTDKNMERLLAREFPDRKSVRRLLEGKITMGYFRTLYNAGMLTQGVKPEQRSHRYNEFGKIDDRAPGRPRLTKPVPSTNDGAGMTASCSHGQMIGSHSKA